MKFRWSRHLPLWLFYGAFFWSSISSSGSCRSAFREPHAKVALATIFTSPRLVLTHYLPSKSRGGTYQRFDQKGFDQSLPEHFIAGDGVLELPFVRVNQAPGASLDQRLNLYENEITEMALERGINFRKATIKWLKTHLLDFMPPVVNLKTHPYFQGEQRPEALLTKFKSLKSARPGHEPVSTDFVHPVYNLERYMTPEVGSFCFHKAIVSSLILHRAGIPHRILSASVKNSLEVDHFFGHTVIELADGRILDPTKQTLSLKTSKGLSDGWSRYGSSYLLDSQLHHYLVLDQ